MGTQAVTKINSSESTPRSVEITRLQRQVQRTLAVRYDSVRTLSGLPCSRKRTVPTR